MILARLFFSFFQIGLFSIGGGYAAMPLIQHQVVDVNAWLTQAEFADLVTISYMTPGPISLNAATFVGVRMAGVGGIVAAMLGCVLPSCVVVSLLALAYRRWRGLPMLDGVLAALRPAVVALIAAAGLSILAGVLFPDDAGAVHVVGAVLFAGSFVVLRRFRANPMLVMALCGVLGLLAGLPTVL